MELAHCLRDHQQPPWNGGTTVEKSSAEPDLYKRGAAYRIESARVDGLDPVAVVDAAQHATEVARAGRPYLLEVVSERLRGHSVVDPAKYRSADEVANLKEHDPVHALAVRLVAEGACDDDTLAVLDQEIMANIPSSTFSIKVDDKTYERERM